MDGVKRRIPINPQAFGDFNRGNNLKMALLYYWLRTLSSYDDVNMVEYLRVDLNRPGQLSCRNVSKKFGYSKNFVNQCFNAFIENGLMEYNDDYGRYEFILDFGPEYVIIDLDILIELVEYCIEKAPRVNGEAVLIYGLLRRKFSVSSKYKKGWVFSATKLQKWLGYSDTTRSVRIQKVLDDMVDNGWIRFVRTDFDNSPIPQYGQFLELLDMPREK